MTLRLFLAQPSVVFMARVSQSSFTYPLAQVTFDTAGPGAYTDIEPGMTILFGSSAGEDDYGRQRIRKAATSTVLYFGRSSRGTRDGEVDLVDNAYITILQDFRVWSKIPYIDDDGVIYKDADIAVGTYTTNIPPVANAGAPMAGTVDSGTDLLRVTLPHEANKSFAVSGAISSYAWTLPAGVALVGGYALSDSQIEVDCDPGFYWVKLVVTDSNAETHTARVPIYARDPASDTSIGSFTIETHRITQEGQRLTVRILEDIAESTYPDGTLVMIWEDEPSSGTDRSHMIFTGWHQSDPTVIAAQRTGILRDTTLELLDVAGRLDTLPGFSGSVEVAASPASWSQMTTPNMDKYLHYLLHWHSTALEVADWTWSGTTTNFPFVVLGNAAESLWDQVARRAKALVPDYVLSCNTIGQLQTVIDPMLQDSGDRTATVQATLQEADWSSIRYNHQRPPRAHWLRGEAIVASAVNIAAIFCVAPGEAPGQGESAISQGEQLAVSQSTLNACEGHRYARLNAPQGYFSIALAEGDDQGIEPSDMTWVRLNVSASTAAQRGLTFSNERGLVREISIRYDHTRTGLVKQVELLWERETSGTPAVTVLMPEMGLPDPEWEPPSLAYGILPEVQLALTPPAQPFTGAQVLMGGASHAQYSAWADFYGGTPSWTALTDWSAGDYDRHCVLPGESVPTLLAYSTYDGAPEDGDEVICEYGPLPLGSGSWTIRQTSEDIIGELGYTIGEADYFGISRIIVDLRAGNERHAWAVGQLGYDDGTEHAVGFVLYTQDGFTTITYATVLFDLDEDDGNPWWTLSEHNAIDVDLHTGYVYAALAKTTWDADDDPGWLRLYRSTNDGFTFTLCQEWTFNDGDGGYYGGDNDWCADVWCPWVSDTSNGGTVFWTAQLRKNADASPAVYEPRVYRSQNHGITATNIGDDGGLATCLIRLLGPWNSAEYVWGLACTYDESTTAPAVYTWRNGYGWSKWSGEDNGGWESFAPFSVNIYTFGIIAQDGYSPEEVVWRQFPWIMDDTTIDDDREFPNNRAGWVTFIPSTS